MDNRVEPKNPPHPGEVLAEILEMHEIGRVEFAEHLGISRQSLSKVLNARGGISPTLAIRLEAALPTDAETWLTMQRKWDLAQARKMQDELVKNIPPMLDGRAA